MPSEVNPETLDYLRMQLEDKVRANLEVSLFAHYRKLASSILFVLSFVGVAALWGLQTYLQTYIKDEVASRVTQEVEKQVQAPVREAVNEVNKQQKSIALTLMNTESRLEEASEDESRLGLKIVDIKGAISDAKAETKAIGEKMEDTADDVDANVTLMQP